MVKAVIFDMDGVIVDTEPLLSKAVIKAFKNQKLNLTEKEYFEHWTRKGGNTKSFVQAKKVSFDFDRYRKEKREIYLDSLKLNVPIIQGVKEKIKQLSKTYKLALVSSSDKEFIDLILDKTELKKYFSIVVGGDEVKEEKPSPEGFLLAAKKMEVEPKECIVLEDAEKGIIAAKAAKMKVIAIPNKYTANNNFSKADLIAKNINEVEI